MLKLLPVLLCLALLGTACSHVEPPAPAAAAPAYQYQGKVVRALTFTSKITGISYPYHVYLPVGYEAAPAQRYPLLVATDGQWSFPAYARMLDQRRKPMILVSIEQGPGDRRAIDYTPKGATAFMRVLKEELIPMVDAAYRTSPERSFTGTSYGGLLGGLLLNAETGEQPYFRNYLLFDAAFWALQREHLQEEKQLRQQRPSLPVHVILSSATMGNERAVKAYTARWQAHGFAGLTLDYKVFDLKHDDVGDPSFDWAIDLVR
jgi:predicted alpha/beta superfamily hydrolase